MRAEETQSAVADVPEGSVLPLQQRIDVVKHVSVTVRAPLEFENFAGANVFDFGPSVLGSIDAD